MCCFPLCFWAKKRFDEIQKQNRLKKILPNRQSNNAAFRLTANCLYDPTALASN